MPTPPRARSIPWHTIAIVVLTAALLWLFFRNLDFREALEAMAGADRLLLLVAVVVTLQTYALRAARWRVLLLPIGPARFRTAFRATVVGFTALFLLPARIGEVLRPYLLARREGLSAAACFATVIIERLLDLVTVLVLFGVAIFASGVDVGREATIVGVAAMGLAAVALVVLAILAGHPERLGRWAAGAARFLPGRAGRAVGGLVQTFAEGLKVMRSPGHLVVAVLWSLPIWMSIGLGIYLTTRAFDLTMGFMGSFLVMGYLALGVSAPTPGGAGGFHWAYLLALTQFFGASESRAGAAAIVLHAVSFVPVTVLGLVFMWQDGLTLGRLKGMRGEATAAEKGNPA